MSHQDRLTLSASDSAARVRQAFASKPIDFGVLQSAVHAYVDAMKQVGATAERIIIEIKRIAGAELGPGHVVAKWDAKTPNDTVAVSRAVTYCIERYFAPGESR